MTRTLPLSTLILVLGAFAWSLSGCDDDTDADPEMDAGAGSDASAGSGEGARTDADAPPGDATESDAGAPAPLELSPTLCDDPSNLQVLVESLGARGMQDGDGGLDMNEDELPKLLANPTATFYMVNLIKYRELARYSDGRETDLTGREANALYNPLPFITAMGGRVVYNSSVDQQIDGADDVAWDDVAIVEYPCAIGFLAMVTHPDFQATSIHKDAGVETTRVMFTRLRPLPAPADPEQSEAAFPPTAEDPAFDLIHVMDFHDIAQYEPDANEPERTGEDAWDLYQSGGTGASSELGHYPTAFFDVTGTLIGENTGWDQIQMIHMSSMAGFQALLDDDTRQAGRYHRHAALADNDSMIAFPNLSQIPYVDSDPGGGALLPVTDDGIGTICSADADCPGDGVDTCLSEGGGPGFCTREGCGAGECGAPYACCRDCAEALAAMLPFDGSACLPEGVVAQLTGPPLSCVCD